MNWTILPDGRKCLPEGTILKLEEGGCYRILGAPVGYGGAGILYPAVRVTERDGLWEEDKMWVALKECFPIGTDGMLDRNEKGVIYCVSETDSYTGEYYDYAKEMLRREKKITGEIFNRGFRLTPIWSMAEREEISFDGKIFYPAENQYGIMERLDEKGISLGSVLKEQEGGCLTAYQSICVLEQVLQAIDEVHRNGYLHGDIQENNIFLKGTRFEESIVTLIDFGSARAFLEDGATAMITDRKLYSTSGYSAPECSTGNDGTLRLTRAADLYSVGYLMLRMLTGKAMDTRALQLVVNGKYLYSRQAKKIGCPSGSIEAVNRILQKALEENPADRYQSAEEMLEEIRRLERALAPAKSVIASVDYEAFISYCHEEKSIQAAEQIQKMIERYRIPKQIRKLSGKEQLKKVFRDREELSSSSDMEVHLKEALDHSDYLIVLLSPGVPESLWVKREIELFLQIHDRDHVLTVLVDGELQEVYPEILRKREKYADGQMKLLPVEGLAADIRWTEPKELKRKLKTEIYRLLSPMLGCSYDDLRQRQREHRFKTRLRFMTAAVIVFGVIAAYMGWQAYQIHENYWETLTKQFRYLAQVSADLLDEGDRVKAVQVALEALPDSETDESKPLVPEAEAAFADALNVYQGVMSNAEFMHADFQMEMDTKSAGMETLSPDGRYLLALDENKTMYVWDAVTGVLERRWDREFWNQQEIGSEFLFCDFLNEDTILLVTERGMLQIGIETGQVLENFAFDSRLTREDVSYGWVREIIGEGSYLPESYKSYLERSTIDGRCCALSQDKAYLAVYDQFSSAGRLSVYELSGGEKIYTADLGSLFEENLGSSGLLEQVTFSPDGTQVAVVYSTDWFEGERKNRGMAVVTDLQEETQFAVTDEENGFYQLCFLENGTLAFLGYDPDIHTSIGISAARDYFSVKCYDPQKQVWLWTTEQEGQFEQDLVTGLWQHKDNGSLLAWCNQKLVELDVLTGEEKAGNICESSIVEVMYRREDSYLVAYEDGSLSVFTLGDNDLWKVGTEVTRQVSGVIYCKQGDTETMYQISEEIGIIGCLTRKTDDRMVQVDVGEGITGLSFYEDMPCYAVRRTADADGYIQNFYDLEDHTELFELQTDSNITDSVWMADQRTFCYIQRTDEGTLLTAYDSVEKAEIWTQILKEYDVTDVTLERTTTGETLAICQEYLFTEIFNLDMGEWEEKMLLTDHPAAQTMNPGNINQSYITRDGRYVVLVERYTQFTDGEEASLAVYDRKEECWVELAEEIRDLNLLSSYTEIVAVAWDQNLIAVYEEGQGQVCLIDLEQNKILQKIPFSGVKQRRMQFLGDDSGILLWGDDGYLKLWNLEKEAFTMEDTRKLYDVRSINVSLEEDCPYFWVQGMDEEKKPYYTWNSWLMWMYVLEEDGRFCPYVSWWNGIYVPETDRFISINNNNDGVYWYDRYSLNELLELGHEVVGGQELSESDKAKYFIAE